MNEEGKRRARRRVASLVAMTLLVCAGPTRAQAGVEEHLLEANQARLGVNERGMMVLMGWSAVNLASGAAGWALSEDPKWRAFHQMNLAWNLVNATLGVFGYLDAVGADPGSFGLVETIEQNVSIQKILMINTGLDVAYMAAGAYLWEKGRNDQDPRFVGFGQSLIMQGAFLFAFDIALVLMHQSHHDGFMLSLDRAGLDGWKASFSLRF